MIKKKASNELTSHSVSHIYSEKYFSSQVDGFREFVKFDGSFETLFERFKRNIILLDLKKEDHLLEIGCGRGEVCIFHAKRGGKALGVDYSRAAIDMALEKSNALKVDVNFQCASFLDAIINESGYDKILASEFIEHISKKEGDLFLKKAYKSLRSTGRLLIFTYPNTLQRKYGYPLMFLLSRINGKRIPWRQEDTLDDHYRLYHLNEQNIFSLAGMAKKAGFKRITTGYDTRDHQSKNILKKIVCGTPLKHIFLNNLFLIAEK